MRVLIIAALLSLSACAYAPRPDDIAFAKCGPDGTVDWDDNRAAPPPHCNRDGWDGHRYRGES
jgi:hypothetical protein